MGVRDDTSRLRVQMKGGKRERETDGDSIFTDGVLTPGEETGDTHRSHRPDVLSVTAFFNFFPTAVCTKKQKRGGVKMPNILPVRECVDFFFRGCVRATRGVKLAIASVDDARMPSGGIPRNRRVSD